MPSSRIDHAASHHRENLVAVRERIVERPQQHCADTFSGHDPVRGLVEGAARQPRAEHLHPAQRDMVREMQDHVHTAGNGLAAFAAANRFAGEMERRQR
nr:hypothetical protein [Burkholderia ubonensis]